ncbi:MAG: SPASM domain-containing protein, partial [Candidatus Helarchaeota archaeon]
VNANLLKKLNELMDPINIYVYYEVIPEYVTKLADFKSKFNLPILLELNEKIIDLDFRNFKDLQLIINDDSIARLINAIRFRAYLKFEAFKNQILLPYCEVCKNKLFFGGTGDIYACNIGFRCNDKIGSLDDDNLKNILNSKKFQNLRKKIVENSLRCQKKSCLAFFYSGCLYGNYLGKFSIMKKIIQEFIK